MVNNIPMNYWTQLISNMVYQYVLRTHRHLWLDHYFGMRRGRESTTVGRVHYLTAFCLEPYGLQHLQRTTSSRFAKDTSLARSLRDYGIEPNATAHCTG